MVLAYEDIHLAHRGGGVTPSLELGPGGHALDVAGWQLVPLRVQLAAHDAGVRQQVVV